MKRDLRSLTVGDEVIGYWEEVNDKIHGSVIVDKQTVALVPPQRTLYRVQQIVSQVRYFNFKANHVPTKPYKNDRGVWMYDGDMFDEVCADDLELDLSGTFAQQLNAEAAMRRVLREECERCSDVLQLYYASAPPERWLRMDWWQYRFGKGYSLV